MLKAFMFSGQGSQYVGMCKELYDEYDSVRNLFEKANQILGYKLEEVVFENEELIHQTEYTQVAMFVMYAAILDVLQKHDIDAEYTLGLSLGEYGALYHAGVFDFETGVKLLQKRGEVMQEVSNRVSGKMSAILGLDAEILLGIIDQVEEYVKIANYNTYGQLVISGDEQGVEQVNKLALEAGAKRAIMLNTSGPFHTDLMEEASKQFGLFVNEFDFNEPQKKLLLNTNGSFYESDIKQEMVSQITSSVLFYQMIEVCLEQGVDTFIEIGPKKTLSSFVKKVNRKVNVLQVEDLASLNQTISKLEVE